MKKLILVLALGLFQISLWGQGATLSLTGDTAVISIGEQVILTLEAKFKGAPTAQLPLLPDTISGLTLVKTSPIDTLTGEKDQTLSQRFTITSFDSGFVVIPALKLVGDAGQMLAQSKRYIVEVKMPEVSEEQAAYDIKDPLKVKKPLWETLRLVLLALAVAAAVGLAIWYLRKTKKPEAAQAMQRGVSPHESALAALKALEQKELWQNNKLKDYYSQLIDVLRAYLEDAYALKAMESTAAELSQKINRLPLENSLKQDLAEMLSTSALVKYAKEKPLAEENTRALITVRSLVQATLKNQAAHV